MRLSFLLVAGTIAGGTTLCDLCGSPSAANAAESTVSATALSQAAIPTATDSVTLRINGMTCGGCAIAARKVLERLDGVVKADVSYENGVAIVTYDPAKVTTTQMIAAVATLRYTATVGR